MVLQHLIFSYFRDTKRPTSRNHLYFTFTYFCASYWKKSASWVTFHAKEKLPVRKWPFMTVDLVDDGSCYYSLTFPSANNKKLRQLATTSYEELWADWSYLIIQRDEVLDFWLWYSVLGGGDVGQCVRHQHPPVLQVINVSADVLSVLLLNVLPQNVLVFKTSFLQNVLPQNVLPQDVPSTKRPWIQNILVYKTSRPQNVLPSKRPHLQNVLAFKTSFHKTFFPLSFHKTSFLNSCISLYKREQFHANENEMQYVYSESSNIGLVVLDFLQANDAKSRPSQYCLIHYR